MFSNYFNHLDCPMKKILFILLAVTTPVFLFAAEPVREWKSQSGKVIRAAFDDENDSDSETVPLIINGKRTKTSFKNLSQKDQEYVTRIRNSKRSGSEPIRIWSTQSGKVIRASLDVEDDSDPDTVYLLKDGKRYKIPLRVLSLEDQAYVIKVRGNGKGIDEDADFELVEDNADSLSTGDSRSMRVVPAGNRYALLIGVNEYSKPIKSLQFCVSDMELLAQCFERNGVPKDNIILVTDNSPSEFRPTGANIRRQIENITQLMQSNDQLIVAFSGHGAMVDGASYLCPCDANLDDRNTIIPRDWAFAQLEKCKAKQKIFIIDACRDEVAFGSQKALRGAKSLEDPFGSKTHGFILISSCDKKQKSWEHTNLKHGVFTYFLAEGLSGEAKDEDGIVSVMNLFHYASSKTKKYVYSEFNNVQVPTFHPGGEMTDFCVAKQDDAESFPSNPTVITSPSPVTALPSSASKAGTRKVVTVNGVEFAFRWCPPGKFLMGSPEWEKDRESDETQHKVTLTKGFWIMETEVTQKQWVAILGEASNPSEFKGDDLPVESVPFDEILRFFKKCAYLGFPVDLPTEAQWEYACRAGSTTAFSWGDSLNGDKANCNGQRPYETRKEGKYIEKTTPVGSYPPNAWGLYDMHGNVWESCKDRQRRFSTESETDPIGDEQPGGLSGHCNCRGGGWDSSGSGCRSAQRWSSGYINKSDIGFRCILKQ